MSAEPETLLTPRVFVSYRSRDEAGRAIAPVLAERLKADLGGPHVFYSETDIPRGHDYLHEMQRRIAEATLVIVVIGPSWEDLVVDPLEEPETDDWVRLEVATALAQPDTSVVPLLVGRRSSPPRARLPEDMREIATMNGIADFAMDRDYHSVLFDAWASYHRSMQDVRLVVADPSARGVVDLDGFLTRLEADGALDTERFRQLSQIITAPYGMAAVPLARILEGFDDDVLLLEPTTPTERWRRRRAAVDAWVARNPGTTVNVVAGVGTSAVVLGAPEGARWGRRLVTWWRDLAMGAKAGVVGGGALVAVVGSSLSGGGFTPTAFTYADVVYQTGDVVVQSHPPDADPAEPDPDPGVDHVLMELSLEKQVPDSTDALRYGRMDAARTWSLQLGGDEPVPAEGTVHDGVDWMLTTWDLAPGAATDLLVAFPIPAAASLDDPVLHMRVNDMSPLTVPLDGEPVTTPEVDVSVGNPSWNGPFSFGQAAFEITDAWASPEAGFDESTGEPYVAPQSGFQRRALDGSVFLHVDLEVLGLEFGGEMVSDALLMGDHYVLADGERHDGVQDYFPRFGLQLPAGNPVGYHLVAPVPVDATEVQVVVQDSGGNDRYVIETDESFLDAVRDTSGLAATAG